MQHNKSINKVKSLGKKDCKQKEKEKKKNNKQSKIHSREFSPYSQMILYKYSFERVSDAIRELILNNTNQY